MEEAQWTALVITCANASWSQSVQKELEIRQAKGLLDSNTLLLTVEDPKHSVGSGGATVNALLIVTEYLSAQQGYTVINSDVLKNARILILHLGRMYPYEPCGRAFMPVPAEYHASEVDSLICNLDILIKNITEKLLVKSGSGIWISSTDMVLSLPENANIPWKDCDVAAITVPSTPKYCRNHGVYKINPEGYVEDILYKKDLGLLESCERPDGSVPVVCSVVYISRNVADTLLSFYTKPPLDACTYMGVDNGEIAIQLSLYFDVMLAMCNGVSMEEFVSGKRSGIKGEGQSKDLDATMTTARKMLWRELHHYKIWSCMIEEGDFHYLEAVPLDHDNLVQCCPYRNNFASKSLQWGNTVHSYLQDRSKLDAEAIVINSIIMDGVSVDAKSIVVDSYLNGNIEIGRQCLLTGVKIYDLKKKKKIKFSDHMCIQGFKVYIQALGQTVDILTTHGKYDRIETPMWNTTTTFCNWPWMVFLGRTGIQKEDLWGPDMDTDNENVFQAKMFPVFHATQPVGLQEILWLQGEVEDDEKKTILKRWRSSWRLSLSDILSVLSFDEQVKWKKYANIGRTIGNNTVRDRWTYDKTPRRLFYDVGKFNIHWVLVNTKNIGFRPLYKSAVEEGYSQDLIEHLDQVALECADRPGITARTLANIGDLLGCMGGAKSGLRSGPAANKDWSKAFHLLEQGNIVSGLETMKKVRELWLLQPGNYHRVARHYEGAAQILIRQAVMSAKENFVLGACEKPDFGFWVLAECPARIDISGGWSDTPPITYEHGGAVATIGLKVNDKKPIGAKTRRLKECKFVFVQYSLSGDASTVVCEELCDLENYYQPHAPGALLKAAVICAELVNLKSDKSLSEQLKANFDGGVEIHTWANLPHGSGMGTSSILAGAVLASLLRACGKTCDQRGLIHAVLYLEQLLTTGGGWQDQVGGLMGGIHLGLSESKLPLVVESVNLKPTPELIEGINERLVLIYTGKTRLARNILQDAVRNWYARLPKIVETEDNLVILAQSCSTALLEGDFVSVGRCMDLYWALKKRMAPGCETEVIRSLMECLRPFVLGMCMAGAGGGGFMFALAKDKANKDTIRNMIPKVQDEFCMDSLDLKGAVMYEACVDMDGLVLKILEEK